MTFYILFCHSRGYIYLIQRVMHHELLCLLNNQIIIEKERIRIHDTVFNTLTEFNTNGLCTAGLQWSWIFLFCIGKKEIYGRAQTLSEAADGMSRNHWNCLRWIFDPKNGNNWFVRRVRQSWLASPKLVVFKLVYAWLVSRQAFSSCSTIWPISYRRWPYHMSYSL